MIDVMERFLEDEISSQELYEEIYSFIDSFHIRNGEFEANYYIIKKMDQYNFFIYAENIFPDNHREIPYSLSIYKNDLIKSINRYAQLNGFTLMGNLDS
ncbi:hypothetical protein QCD85_16120 [Paenibacillus sp. PsM32]|uniref:hypothetical protein n=1 Tax=Paenibacillus sp. PsM32 TaxID=3030536 RepID=UPI00263B6507|nr:hypothetical protein [Paenibacillus sp. PsM32]MDN4619636.1 hypothetical protein [Paenibacillus sp. PsM32]